MRPHSEAVTYDCYELRRCSDECLGSREQPTRTLGSEIEKPARLRLLIKQPLMKMDISDTCFVSCYSILN